MNQSIANPYRMGTHAHAMFNNLLPSKLSASKDDLVRQYKACRRHADNWLNQGDQARSQFDFEAQVISNIFEQRFDQTIEFACWQRA